MDDNKKLIIAGGRDYKMTRADVEHLSAIVANHGYKEIISGGANGADLCGEVFAYCMNMPLTRITARWDKHGKAAGPIRNKGMAKRGQGLAFFTGGQGTKSMISEAKAAGLLIHDFRQ
jgi:predicted Rossmann-fold nucleotide-binding protein